MKRIDTITVGGHEFLTLVAVTQSEHEKGLMFKEWPPPIMSFPYHTAEIRNFWMKNTPSPLDIVFCCNGCIVDIKHGKPYDVTLISPKSESDLVIEFPYGTVSSYNIKIGDIVNIKYSLDTLFKKISYI